MYRGLLEKIPGILLQSEQRGGESVYWMNGVCLSEDYGRNRDELISHLTACEIDTRLFFNGMHRQPALNNYGCECSESYVVSDMLADNGFYLPSGSSLSESDIERVCRCISEFRG